ncbi:hypothetical protein ACHAXR_012379, partial [Thalassiosira sp. AJA248-18]
NSPLETMILRNFIAVGATAAACARPIHFAAARGVRRLDDAYNNEYSYTTDMCVSVIAIAGSPDYRYLQENGIDIDVYDQGEEFVCELNTGLTVPIKGTEEQMHMMQSLLHEGTFISSEMTIGIADNLMSLHGDDSVYLPPGNIILAPRNDRTTRRRTRKMLKGARSNLGRDDYDSRNLAVGSRLPYEGPKPILAVRVTDSDGNVHQDNARTVSDNIFGTYGDLVNAKSQFEACSFGKLDVTDEYSTDISKKLSDRGVIDIEIPIPLLGNDRSAIRAAVVTAAEEKLGFVLPGPFQHVMFVIEKCYTDCGWAAYAYVNSWLSIYQGNNYRYVAVQMHELGHNLNLAHSGGIDGKTYTDHTGLMGNPYYEDEEGAMCFNPAKVFQIARGVGSWFNENDHDIKEWNSGTTGGTNWSGKIIGIADYKNNPNSRPVVVKLESGGPNDLFVGFNRAEGNNKEVADARDQVTVIEAGNDGLGYSQSYLKATLSEGEVYSIANWRGSGLELTIFVREINIGSNPGYADVLITLGDLPTQTPTLQTTLAPTSKPSKNPTGQPTSKPTMNPTGQPTNTPSKSPTKATVIWSQCGNSVCEKDENSSTCPVDCLGRELDTTFEYKLGSGGNMFTVEAKRNIVISSFAINSNSLGQGEVKVYSRKGSYAGHLHSSDGWDLIYDNPTLDHERRGRPTELGEFQRVVMIPQGTSQSFFVTSSIGLVYRAGSQEHSEFSSDESLSILEGVGTDATFSNTMFSPRVWGGIIRYNVIDTTLVPTMSPIPSLGTHTEKCGDAVCAMNEDSESCPADCAGRGLETTFDFSLGSSGNMFSLKAMRDISISTFTVNAMRKGQGAVKVYTRNGSYIGHEQNSAGWELIYDNSEVDHGRRGQPTELGDFDNAVFIASGATQSFLVTSSKGLVYEAGAGEGDLFASDESLVIYEGIGTTGEFAGNTYSPRVFGGIIRYDAYQTTPVVCGDSVCAMNEDSESCPADCAGKELETTFDFSLGSSGNMFNLKALRDIYVSSFAINAMGKGQGAVKVYTRNGSYIGHEQNSAGWELIYDNSEVDHGRRGQPTELGDFDNAVFIASGATQSFFVTSSKGLVYEAGTKEGDQIAIDESLVVYEGIGTTGEFAGDTYSPRVFGGKISTKALLREPYSGLIVIVEKCLEMDA